MQNVDKLFGLYHHMQEFQKDAQILILFDDS